MNVRHPLGITRHPDVHGLVRQKPGQHSQRPTLLVLCPLDALEVNAILYHLPERAAKEKRYWVSKGLDSKQPTLVSDPEP